MLSCVIQPGEQVTEGWIESDLSVGGVDEAVAGLFHAEEVDNHEQEGPGDEADGTAESPGPKVTGNGTGQSDDHYSEEHPPLHAPSGLKPGEEQGNEGYEAEQEHAGEGGLLIELVAEVPLAGTKGGGQLGEELVETVVLGG